MIEAANSAGWASTDSARHCGRFPADGDAVAFSIDQRGLPFPGRSLSALLCLIWIGSRPYGAVPSSRGHLGKGSISREVWPAPTRVASIPGEWGWGCAPSPDDVPAAVG